MLLVTQRVMFRTRPLQENTLPPVFRPIRNSEELSTRFATLVGVWYAWNRRSEESIFIGTQRKLLAHRGGIVFPVVCD